MKHPSKNKPTTCPCESGKSYTECCQPYHKGAPVPSAELLMRARYTAYTLLLEDYLLNTWHPNTRPSTLDLSDSISRKWLGLTIKQAETISENAASVEFIARYKDGGSKAERLHEISNFILLDHWYYVDGLFAN